MACVIRINAQRASLPGQQESTRVGTHTTLGCSYTSGLDVEEPHYMFTIVINPDYSGPMMLWLSSIIYKIK